MRRLFPLLAAALLAYGGALRGSFHFDDYSLLANPLITSGEGLWRMWQPFQMRPLTNLTFWLNYQLGGADPIGYHAVNLALHLVAVGLLFTALRLFMPEAAAFWGALIFAAHPMQSEAINYVFARGTLLSTVFCLACLIFWLRGKPVAAIALFACALLAKEECVTFPLVLLLLTPARAQLRPFAIMMGLAGLAGLRAVWSSAYTPGSGAGFTAGIGPWEYAAAQGAALAHYLQMLVAPWGFTVEPTITASVTIRVLAWLGVGLGAFAAWKFRYRFPAALWIVAALVLIVPSSTIFPAADLAAERRMYLPMTAFAAAFGLVAPLLGKHVPAAIAIVLIILSFFRTETWRTERSLWSEAVQRSPTHVRPLLQLSRAVPPPEAPALLTQAKALNAANPGVYSEFGSFWLKQGRFDLALSEFGRALALQPNDANALNNRGAALLGLKQERAARQDFERALKADPCVLAARNNLRALGATNLPPCKFIEK